MRWRTHVLGSVVGGRADGRLRGRRRRPRIDL